MRGRARVVGYRTPGFEPGQRPVSGRGCGPAVVVFCLSWLVVGLPVLACVLGWVWR